MGFRELLEMKTSARGEVKHKSLLLIDVDDTLLTASNIFIHRKLPTDNTTVKLTPEQYASERITPENKKYYNYKEFEDSEKVFNSIKTGIPLIPNLAVMDNYIKNNWDIGILTARGMEETVFNALKNFLMYRNKKGELEGIGSKLVRDLIFAVNTTNNNISKYDSYGKTDYEKKKNIILKMTDKYERVHFIDDDMKNINAVNNMIKELRTKKDNRAGKIRTIIAKPNSREHIENAKKYQRK